MKRSVIILGVGIISASMLGLFQVKYKVQNLKHDLIETSRQLALEKEHIHVLNAEWTYLTQPVRIEQLVDRYLEMTPIDVSQMQYGFEQETEPKLAATVNPSRVLPTLKPILSRAVGGI